MMPSLDMTLCRRFVAAGPRSLNGLIRRFPTPLPAIRPAPLGDRCKLVLGSVEQIELSIDVVVRCGSRTDTGRQPLHQPTTRYSDQFPLHRTELLQRHCA